MKKGALIGKGMTAEVYEWGRNQVLKLFFDRFKDEWVDYEAKIGTAVHEAGVPSPEVFDTIELEGRRGIIYQRISGTSIMKHIQAEPWNISLYTKQLTELQFRIHQCSAASLPTQGERFAARIKGSPKIPDDKVQRILGYIEKLPDGTSICHGDLHFNNIIVSNNKLVPIDWANAYQGNPLGDVARTCLMMVSPAVKLPYVPAQMDYLSQYIKWMTHGIYLYEYMGLTKARLEDIDTWTLPAAAAKLRDKVPGEEKWLMDMIDKRLQQ